MPGTQRPGKWPMCGIAGVMMKDGKAVDEPVLKRLRSALGHRGPDSTGHYVRRAIGLVSTRLSIVDVGGGDQPLLGPDGTAVVCNGEIYNAPELRREFPGYPFHTWSDCGPVVPLVERDGTDFARSLRGMYGLAVYRPAAGTLLLARDPFGIKPLYYADMGHCFAFASELQALLRAGLACAAVEPAARNEFFQLKYTTGRRTVVPGVQRVAPGETLVLRDGEIVGRRQLPIIPSDDVAGRATPRDRRRRPIWAERPRALRRFERVMLDAVEVHLRMDTSWRLFLSGGVDSSILLALAQRVLDRRPVRALTVGYSDAEDGMDESAAAMRIAGRAGADCARVEMSPEDFWTLAPRIAAAIDDPTADPAVLPTYVLGRAASVAGAKVALTGEGADEIFGGYSRYRKATLPRLFRRRGPRCGVFTNAGIGTERFGAWEAGI